MTKRILTIILTLVLIAALTACSGISPGNPAPDPTIGNGGQASPGSTQENSTATPENGGTAPDSEGEGSLQGMMPGMPAMPADGGTVKAFFAQDEYFFAIEIPLDDDPEMSLYGIDMLFAEMHCKNGEAAIILSVGGFSYRAISQGGYDYIIIDTEKAYFKTNEKDETVQAVADIGDAVLTGTGRDVFDGREYDYEDYVSPDGAVYRYFVENGLPIGMRVSGTDTRITGAGNTADAGRFGIPAGYQEIDPFEGMMLLLSGMFGDMFG